MEKPGIFNRITLCVFMLLLAFPFSAISQQSEYGGGAESPEQVFRPEELDQLLAPIALYPDALLAQVLTSATYPLDIVAADRFVKVNPGLRGEFLMDAAKDKDWEPSVKAMLQFPDVLAMMDNQIEWTTKIGDAYLAQQREVMDSVQRLRKKAYEQGKLVSTNEQVVKVEPQTQVIIVEPANPEIVYVPVYDPAAVYGVWWYPDYPPYRCYYPGYVSGFFLTGCFVDLGWGWGSWGCDWHRHFVIINIFNFNNFTRRNFIRHERFRIHNNANGRAIWQHNPQFRRGVHYRDSWTRERFGGRQVSNTTVTSGASNFRGREQAQVRQSVPVARTERPENVKLSRPGTELNRGGENQRINQAPVNIPAARRESRESIRPAATEVSHRQEGFSALSGAGRGASERAASFRGESSIRSFRSSSNLSVSRGRSEGARQSSARIEVRGGADGRGDSSHR